MSDRYFVEEPISGSHARLAAAEAHHLAHVMRARVGDEVTLFDGSGAEFLARVERLGRAEIELAVIERRAIDRELPAPLWLAVSLPKGDRQRWLVEKATELGVSRLVPLVSQRGAERQSPAVVDRLRRYVIEASKQCGRNRLMEITAFVPLDEFIHSTSPEAHRIVAHRDAPSIAPLLDALDPRQPAPIVAVVGPEGGLTPEELQRAKAAGWQLASLGARTLRIETAALAVASAIVARLERPAAG